jgi:hypothetical protein
VEVEVKEKGYSTNKLIFSEVITMSNAQRLLSIPVTEEWRGNAEVHITAVRNNELLSWTHSGQRSLHQQGVGRETGDLPQGDEPR